jgi:hypothetical protein
MKRWYVEPLNREAYAATSRWPNAPRVWFGELFANNRVARGLRIVSALGTLSHDEAIWCAEYVGWAPSKPGYTNFKAHLWTEQHMDEDGYQAWVRRYRRRLPADALRRKRHEFVVVDARPAFEVSHHCPRMISCELAPRAILRALDGTRLEQATGEIERYMERAEITCGRRKRPGLSPQLDYRLRSLVQEAVDHWTQALSDEIRVRRAHRLDAIDPLRRNQIKTPDRHP